MSTDDADDKLVMSLRPATPFTDPKGFSRNAAIAVLLNRALAVEGADGSSVP